jgi:hypothetical protein
MRELHANPFERLLFSSRVQRHGRSCARTHSILPLAGELWELIERRWITRTIEKQDGITKLSEFVLHRNGRLIVDFRKPWKVAGKKAQV